MKDAPRALMLNEFPGRWNHASPPPAFKHSSGADAWIVALQGDYWGGRPPVPADLREYDLVVANLFPTFIEAYAELAEHRPPHIKWASLIEGPGEWYLDELPGLRRALDASDLVMTINRNTTDFFRSVTRARVENVGIPYPVDFMRSLRTPVEERRKEVLVCPRSNRVASIEAARRTGLTIRAHAPKVSRTPKNLPRFLKAGEISRGLDLRRVAAQLPEGSIVNFNTPGEPYFREVGGCYLWMNLDPRYTWARFVLDAAALGVPIISTSNTGHACDLFPNATVRDAFQVSDAVSIARTLIENSSLYQDVVGHADRHLDAYGYEPRARELLKLLY